MPVEGAKSVLIVVQRSNNTMLLTLTKAQCTVLRKAHRQLLALVPHTVTLLDRIGTLIRHIALDDRQITLACINSLTLSDGVASNASSSSSSYMNTTNVNAIQALQMQAIELETAIFRQFPRHRGIVLEDVFPVMLSLTSLSCGRTSRTVQCARWNHSSNNDKGCKYKNTVLILTAASASQYSVPDIAPAAAPPAMAASPCPFSYNPIQ